MILLLAVTAGLWYFFPSNNPKTVNRDSIENIQQLKAKELEHSFTPELLNKNKVQARPQMPAFTEYYSQGFEATKMKAGELNFNDRPSLSSLDERGFSKGIFSRNNIPELGMITIIMANDLFALTDYYYTSGVGMEVIHPIFSFLPTRGLLLPFSSKSINYYGFSVIQDLYTPYDLENSEIQYGDRPFAAYLCIGFSKTSLFHEKALRLKTQIYFGVIGQAALGNFSQDIFHSLEPLGWVNQVNNDVVFNYNIGFSKGLINDNNFELVTVATGRVGSLFTDASIGVVMRFGNELSTFKYYTSLENKGKKFRYDVFLNLAGRAKGYDATLQGGLFNRTSVYVIPESNVERFLFIPSAGINLSYSIVQLRLEQLYSSPEFTGAKHHFFGRISLSFSF
jgi:lipid A 3-O-deacylase